MVALHNRHKNKWSTIARFIPGRTDDACSKRFREALDPRLKKDPWTPAEDTKLLQLYSQLGPKWKEVGEEMLRSGLGCRNRYIPCGIAMSSNVESFSFQIETS